MMMEVSIGRNLESHEMDNTTATGACRAGPAYRASALGAEHLKASLAPQHIM